MKIPIPEGKTNFLHPAIIIVFKIYLKNIYIQTIFPHKKVALLLFTKTHSFGQALAIRRIQFHLDKKKIPFRHDLIFNIFTLSMILIINFDF